MNLQEAKAAIADLANDLIGRVDGVATMELVVEFKDAYGEGLQDIGVELADDWLRRVCKEVVNRTGRGHTEQLALPGMGEVDGFVTVQDGEGGYRRKKLIHASRPDLDDDERIVDENAVAVLRSQSQVKQRNSILRPVMDEHGFATAGEAITWLNGRGEA